MKRTSFETALVAILGRLKGIDDSDLTKAERQIREIARQALGEAVARRTLADIKRDLKAFDRTQRP